MVNKRRKERKKQSRAEQRRERGGINPTYRNYCTNKLLYRLISEGQAEGKHLKMISKIFAQLLCSAEEGADVSVENEGCEEVFEFEDGEWVIISLHENRSLGRVEEDPLENLLIEHPSMSVYQMRRGRVEEEDASDEDEEDSARPVPVRRHISWHLAAWGVPLPVLLSVQRARAHVDRRKLTRSALQRQNLANTRFSLADRRYGQFKQPTQRLYNY